MNVQSPELIVNHISSPKVNAEGNSSSSKILSASQSEPCVHKDVPKNSVVLLLGSFSVKAAVALVSLAFCTVAFSETANRVFDKAPPEMKSAFDVSHEIATVVPEVATISSPEARTHLVAAPVKAGSSVPCIVVPISTVLSCQVRPPPAEYGVSDNPIMCLYRKSVLVAVYVVPV